MCEYRGVCTCKRTLTWHFSHVNWNSSVWNSLWINKWISLRVQYVFSWMQFNLPTLLVAGASSLMYCVSLYIYKYLHISVSVCFTAWLSCETSDRKDFCLIQPFQPCSTKSVLCCFTPGGFMKQALKLWKTMKN